jgi:hypothetical protein
MSTTARRARYPDPPAISPARSRSGRAVVRLNARASADTFFSEGVVAQLDQWGIERFNFPQEIWIYPNVAMGSVGAAPSEVLAVNILTRLIHARDLPVLIGVTTRRALQLAPRFVEECLASRDRQCRRYAIPISALRAWLAMHR